MALSTLARINRFSRSRSEGAPEAPASLLAKWLSVLAGGLPAVQRRAVSASLAFRVWSALATFAITVLLANALGTAAFGAYSFALGWVSILLVLTTFGFHHFNVREITRLRTVDRPDAIGGLVVLSVVIGIMLSLLVVLAAPWLADSLPLSPDPLLEGAFVFAALLLPLLTFNSIRQGTLRGLDRPILAQAPELGLFPALMLVMTLAAILMGTKLTAETALRLNLWAAAVALGFGLLVLLREWRRQGLAWRIELDPVPWFRGAGYSLIIGAAATVNSGADLVMLGALTDAEQTGAYGLAARFALLLTIPMLAVTSGLSHNVSTYFNLGRLGEVESLVRGSGRFVIVVTLALAIVISAVTPFIGTLFGPGFAIASVPLLVLAWSRVAETLFGQASMVLINTRFAGLGAICVSVTAVLNIGLNLALIPAFGMLGAAIATGLAQLVQVALMAGFVRRKLGIVTSPLGPRLRASEPGLGTGPTV